MKYRNESSLLRTETSLLLYKTMLLPYFDYGDVIGARSVQGASQCPILFFTYRDCGGVRTPDLLADALPPDHAAP